MASAETNSSIVLLGKNKAPCKEYSYTTSECGWIMELLLLSSLFSLLYVSIWDGHHLHPSIS